MVKLFLDAAAGADHSKKNDFGETPLHYASRYGHKDIIKLLNDAGAAELPQAKKLKV